MLKKLTVFMGTSLRQELETNRELRQSSALMAALCTPSNLVVACMSCGDVATNRYWRDRGIWFGVNGSETINMMDALRNASRVEGILFYKDGTIQVFVYFFLKGRDAQSTYRYEQQFHLGNTYK